MYSQLNVIWHSVIKNETPDVKRIFLNEWILSCLQIYVVRVSHFIASVTVSLYLQPGRGVISTYPTTSIIHIIYYYVRIQTEQNQSRHIFAANALELHLQYHHLLLRLMSFYVVSFFCCTYYANAHIVCSWDMMYVMNWDASRLVLPHCVISWIYWRPLTALSIEYY